MELTELMEGYDVHVYQSPKYERKLIQQEWEQRSCGVRVKSEFEPYPENDQIFEWLKKNSIFRQTSAWPEHSHSDFTYLMMGSNKVMCAVNVKTKNMSGSEVLNPKDHVYQRTLTVKSQPKGEKLPDELTGILNELEFTEKK